MKFPRSVGQSARHCTTIMISRGSCGLTSFVDIQLDFIKIELEVTLDTFCNCRYRCEPLCLLASNDKKDKEMTYCFHGLLDSRTAIQYFLCPIAKTFVNIEGTLRVEFAVNGKRV